MSETPLAVPRLTGRPYRSHLHPACVPCRKRKSRCNIETHSSSCLMCQAHGTNCSFPTSRGPNPTPRNGTPRGLRSQARERLVSQHISPGSQCNALGTLQHIQHQYDPGSQSSPISIGDTDHENPHVVGPAVTSDNQVLTDYLSATRNSDCGLRLIRPRRTNGSKQILFTLVQKRPVGLTVSSSPSYTKCQIIEKLLEPWTERLLEVYFEKANVCFPLLDKILFQHQYATARERISPALLSSLYAHSLVYWRTDPQLASQRAPDGRFIWNLASEALHSDLFLSPGISIITAILLNIGGRPTTALIGNGVRLGSAVSLAYSLGLNHDPLSWDISQSEKMLRIHTWWALLIYDRWWSLAHGTPPHIQRAFYDVPQPQVEFRLNQGDSERDLGALSVFTALSGLTDVLDYYLQYLYQVKKDASIAAGNLKLRLNRWVDNLEGNVRRVITRGTSLQLPGAANLRLAYLSVQLLTHRVEMESTQSRDNTNDECLTNQYINARRTAEDIVLFVQELQEEHLGDFWLPVNAFTFPSTVSFLLRCALETETSPRELAKNNCVKLAWDLIVALRYHKDNSSWDLGDICLAQYGEVVEKLMVAVETNENDGAILYYEDILIPDDLFINDIFGGAS